MFGFSLKISLWSASGTTLNWSAILVRLPMITIFKLLILFQLKFQKFPKTSTEIITNVSSINECSVNHVFWKNTHVRINCSYKTWNILFNIHIISLIYFSGDGLSLPPVKLPYYSTCDFENSLMLFEYCLLHRMERFSEVSFCFGRFLSVLM